VNDSKISQAACLNPQMIFVEVVIFRQYRNTLSHIFLTGYNLECARGEFGGGKH